MGNLRDEIHDAWARVREDGEVYHADVENTLLVVDDMIEHGVLVPVSGSHAVVKDLIDQGVLPRA